MKTNRLWILFFLFIPMLIQAQTREEILNEELTQLKQEVKEKYSHFTLSIFGGLPFTQGGDMVTLAHDKTYLGWTAGAQLGYQFNPYLGLSLSGQYGDLKAGAKKVETHYYLLPTAQTFYGLNPPADAKLFHDLYSQIKFMQAGLHLDFNLAALFNSSANRKMAVVLSPAVYMQKFTPELKNVNGNAKFANKALDNKLSLGVGGDLDLRFRASRAIDLMLKMGAGWITNNNFDGVDNTGTKLRYGAVGHISAGVVFKFGGKDKVDNIFYAPTSKGLEKIAEERADARIEADRLAKEKADAERRAREEAERLAREKAEAERLAAQEKEVPQEEVVAIPELPTVHFVRGYANIDEHKYAAELARILEVLKANPEQHFELVGFCDHTGSEPLNDRLSVRRAEALKAYLVKHGIDANRLSTRGEGKDPNATGEDAYSVVARRVEVQH